jgi:zinc protease
MRMGISMRTCRMGERDDFVLDVLAHVLGADKTGRLAKRLVHEDQVATNVWVSNEVRLDPGILCIYIELRPGADPERVERLVVEELERLESRGALAGELARAKSQLRSSYLFEEETVLDIALRIGRFESTAVQGHGVLGEVLDQYGSVTSRDLVDVARRYFAPDTWNVATLLPPAPQRSVANGRKKKQQKKSRS